MSLGKCKTQGYLVAFIQENQEPQKGNLVVNLEAQEKWPQERRANYHTSVSKNACLA